MSDVAKIDPRPVAEIDVLRKQIAALTPEIARALPSHIKPEKFSRVVMTVVGMTPELLIADRKSLLASCMKCAADGLVPDGREAALVIFNSKVKTDKGEKYIKKVQYMPMLAGIQKRVRNSGEISSLGAYVVYEQDEFVWVQGTDESLIHKPKFPGPRGKPIGAYSVAKFKDGSVPQFEVMDLDEIEKVRQVSKSKDSGPWKEWWSEMARKTVFRRLSKWLPSSSELGELLGRAEEDPTLTITNEQRAAIESAAAGNMRSIAAPTDRLNVLSMMGAEDDKDGVVIENVAEDQKGEF